ncbi:porin family protein [Desertivirga brevis]|uniref:porin family protein n=1 Tax=Desertivirga brevis TaxID=2810310 RepID=UPI001A9719FA|nr:porin family protein [Pedobacter sp. SYSU D00873]
MKKHLLAAITLLISLSASAQLPKINFGVKGGVNVSKLQADWAKEDNRLGYQAGVWARIGAVGFYVQPEAYLGSKGGELRANENDNNVSGDAKIKFTTLDVPILVGNKIGVDKLNFRYMAGPIFSFLLSKDTRSNFETAVNFRDYKNQTIGAQAGVGVDLGNVTVDLRYEKGLTNINKSGQYDQKQNLWHISLGYKLF